MNAALSGCLSLAPRPEALPSVRELAEIANREHAGALAAAADALAHAVAAGEALLSIRGLVPRGEWKQWVYDNFSAPTMARPYMRLAHYKHLLPADVQFSQVDAIRYLRGLPGTSGNAPAADVANLKDEGVRLIRAGFPEREICDILGVSKGTVNRWRKGDDGYKPTERELRLAEERRSRRAEKHRRRRQALAAAPALAESPDADAAQAHKLIVSAAQILRNAVRREGNTEARGAMVDALRRIALAEEDVSVAASLHEDIHEQEAA